MNAPSSAPVSPQPPCRAGRSVSRETFVRVLRAGAVCLGLVVAQPALGQVLSIQEFLAEEDNWPKHAARSTPLSVEGRASTIAPGVLKLHKCEVTFRAGPGVEFKRPSDDAANLEVSGRLVGTAGKYEFIVETVRVRPGDRAEIDRRQQLLPTDDPRPWYVLADWIDNRAEFYGDRDLAAVALPVRLRGLEIERMKLPAGDAPGLLKLADKAADLKLPDGVRFALLHEAFHVRFRSLEESAAEEWGKLASDLDRALPGCRTPLPADAFPDRARQYLGDPVAAYRAADSAVRTEFHRVLYAEAVRRELLASRAADGSNLQALAEQAALRLPDLPELAGSLREEYVARQMQDIPRMRTDELLRWIAELEKEGQAERARAVRQRWFDAKVPALEQEGPPGMLRLAELARQLFADPAQAAAWAIKAYNANPRAAEPAQFLENLGYVLRGGQWTASPAAPKPPPAADDEIKDRQWVRRHYGTPTSRTRIATRDKVIELWVYAEHGRAIQLERRNRSTDPEPRVTHESLPLPP